MLPCGAATLRRPSLGPVPNRDCLHCRIGASIRQRKNKGAVNVGSEIRPGRLSEPQPLSDRARRRRGDRLLPKVFGATLRMKLDAPGGRVGHAELEIGNGLVMLADEHPEMGALAPTTIGGTPVGLHVYLEDVDAVAKKAVAAGATLKRPVENQFYGDRLGSIIDPFGHLWHISTHVEDVSPEEIGRRAAALGRGHHSWSRGKSRPIPRPA